jgi:hypothetical protein
MREAQEQSEATSLHQRDQWDIEGDKIRDGQLQQKENAKFLNKERYGSNWTR